MNNIDDNHCSIQKNIEIFTSGYWPVLENIVSQANFNIIVPMVSLNHELRSMFFQQRKKRKMYVYDVECTGKQPHNISHWVFVAHVAWASTMNGPFDTSGWPYLLLTCEECGKLNPLPYHNYHRANIFLSKLLASAGPEGRQLIMNAKKELHLLPVEMLIAPCIKAVIKTVFPLYDIETI